MLGRIVAVLAVAAWSAVAGPALGQGAVPGLPRQQMPDRTVSSSAHARYSKAQINLDRPNLALTAALLRAGGATFDANTLIARLTGNTATAQTELAGLNTKFGAGNVMSFERTFTFIAADAVTQAGKFGMALPSTAGPDPTDAKALASAVYAAGVMPGGRFDTEYMLDSLMSHVIHVEVMNDIDANPDLGPAADANYHLVLTQLMMDLKKTYSF